jgi:hypothetical protein
MRFEAIIRETAVAAGRLWRESRRSGSGARERVMADFLIGSHAALQADALLTCDRGFYRRFFRVRLIDPSSSPR